MRRCRNCFRHTRTPAICLLLGVVLTVGVAWGAALVPQPKSDHRAVDPPARWPIPELQEWPAPTDCYWFDEGTVNRWLTIGATNEIMLTWSQVVVRHEAGWPRPAMQYFVAMKSLDKDD